METVGVSDLRRWDFIQIDI